MVLPLQFQLHGHTRSTEKEAKYLGVKITSDLSWDDLATYKANKTLDFHRCNIKTTNERLKNAVYMAFNSEDMC